MIKNSQSKGGRGRRSPNKAKAVGVSLSQEVRDAIAELPQFKSGQWSRSYWIEQLIRNNLGMPADYSQSDLELIANKQIIE